MVTMFNISKGKNKQLMEKCGPLYEYSWFVDMCNEYHLAGAVDEEIVNNVLKEMPDTFEIKPLLIAHKAEVINMILTEWSEEERQRIHEYNLEKAKIEGRKIGLEEGRSEGFKEGKLQGLEEGKLQGLQEGKLQGLEEGKLQGLQEGKTEGLKEGRIQGLKDGMNDALRQTVLRMRKASFSIEQISLATGLTIESINQIINDKQSYNIMQIA